MKILSATTIRNEGPYLLEWIAWHQMLGVTDFLVYSNDCEDGSDRLLDLLDSHAVISHQRHDPPSGKSIQWSALHSAWRHDLRKRADWMLISDLDEFPVIHAGAGRLADLIGAVPADTDAIALPWRLFGANGRSDIADAPVTAQFNRAAPPGMIHPIAATFFKSLFRPKSFAGAGVHRPRHRKEQIPNWVDGSGLAMPSYIGERDKRLSLLGVHENRALAEMHHYSLRSAQGFMVKSQRGLPNRSSKRIDLAYWIERNFNAVENAAALRFQPALVQRIEALKALPGVADLHRSAIDWHRTRFRQIVATPQGYELFCRIRIAAESTVLPDAEQRTLLRMFSRVEASG
ncbi:glycosyltransferase family 2 protein [Paracoccus sediminicola]|uniref:glycosyltransferase family 2 protein n=1 Tax=Paracoccus sediminicola TaxID=3017783 RepID=UPI0022F0EAF6|nr:glycosyltransferase family 2 protein [Paracoccus sediminicola]WBU56438.1 glycosyltransferase family 2 protein [Paracoccus sediminicola]